MRRIHEIDALRGIAIVVMLFFHGSYYWNNQYSVAEINNILNNPFASFAFLLAKFAGIFAVISGMANTISIYSRIESGRNTSSQIFWSSLISGLWLVFIGKIHTSLFNHTMIGDAVNPYPTGPKYYTLIVGTMQTGKLQIPVMYSLLYRNTILFVIGISVICTGALLSILFMGEGNKRVERNFLVVGIVATIIILATQPLKMSLRPLWVTAIVNHDIIASILIGIMIGDSYPLFPFAGYALYGAMFGMAFYLGISKRKVNLVAGFAGLVYLISGLYYLMRLGHPPISEAHETPSIQWNFLQIGSLIFFVVFIYNIHFQKNENILTMIFRSQFLRRFGLLTLTIFIMEGVLGIAIKVFILDVIFGGWANNLILASIYGVSLIVVWYFLLIWWENLNFIGSWEWINAKAISKLTRRKASRLRIKDHLRDLPGQAIP